jgi:L-alanine-DL-glutamate epimerase-like enolase superfamily enzyme
VGLSIASVEAIPVRVERTKPMISAGGAAPLRVSEFGIVRVRASDGTEGIGEVSMNGGRTGAIQCHDVSRLLGPALVGRDPTQLRAPVALMDRVLDGSEPAKAAVEMALVDIVGKVRGLPAHEVLGGAVRERVPVRWGLAFGPPDEGVREAAAWVERGIRTIKVKVGRPGTGLDEAMVRAGARASATGSRSWSTRTPATAPRRRPCRRFGPSRRTGSSSSSSPSVGVTSRGWPGCAAASARPCCELGIGTAAMAHVAVTLPNLAYESDITGHLRYPEDVIRERLDYAGGAIRPPDGPGLGVTLDEDRLRRWRIDV